MKIALFDYVITKANAIGKCDLMLLAGLCREHEFTVFSVEFENPCPDRIRWVHVPAPTKPLALLFVVFHLVAPVCYLWHRIRYRVCFDCIQFIESNLGFGQIAYTHFCHRAFLDRHWNHLRVKGPRGKLRWLDHRLHALVERHVYRHAKWIVTPSRGLAREIASTYPGTTSRIRVVANPVDLPSLSRPRDFDREAAREKLGLTPNHVALAFVALGHYERKGLPTLLQSLAEAADPALKVLVVGGSRAAIAHYRSRADRIGLNGSVTFFETQRDIRSILWAVDALVLPSHYEVFPLVALEAAAAGLPLLATPLNGVEEFLSDADNGFVMEPGVASVCSTIARFAALPPKARTCMGRRARATVQQYGTAQFASAWSKLYTEVALHAR
jgi:glycosyltransferase involved in cell wall biosynthesis